MNAETERVLGVPAPLGGLEPAEHGWRVALPLTATAIVLILAVYWRTAESIVAIWWRSETFAHGFLILPISLFLIWTRRRQLAKLVPVPDYLGLVLLASAGLAWLVAAAGQVQVVQQYALVAMIPAAVIAITGRHVALALAFPLGFLFLGVPIGEALIPPLMVWTADFTVTALRLTGVPVFREGLFFTIPSGNWSIVEGCSGLRYLIASITVGVLFAQLSYNHLWKRILFVVLSVIVPILANGMRAYMIVMIAHLSNNALAHGVDHLIYGWVFFGLVMLLLFWLGSFWRDPVPDAGGDAGDGAATALPRAFRVSSARTAGFAAAAIALTAAWPLYAAYLDRAVGEGQLPALATPISAAGWVAEATTATDWRPHYDVASASVFQTYRKGNRVVVLYVDYYHHQRPGSQLVNSWNIMVVQKHPVWSNVGESARQEDLGAGLVDIRETRLRSARQRLLIWDWFRISSQDLSSPYLAKVLFARNKLLGRGDSGAAIILAAPYDDLPAAAEETLRQFAVEMLPSTYAALAGLETEAGKTGH